MGLINYSRNRNEESFQINCLKSTNKLKQGENYFISPFSIFLLMKILYHGSNGETKKILEKVLSSGLSQGEFKNLSLINKQINSIENLSLANAILTKIKTLDSYLNECKDYDVLISEFKNINQINKWCKKKTKGKIDSIIDNIEEHEKLFLLNAIYFKSKWEKEFIPEKTHKGIFTKTNNEKKEIDFMTKTSIFLYYENEKAQIIKLKYQCQCSAYVILPKTYTIDNYIENITSWEISTMLNSLTQKRVKLFLSKFKIEQNNDFKEILKTMNINICLSENANFSKISEIIKLKIEKILQKGYIEVNEKGTEAVIVTCIVNDEILAPALPKLEPPIIMNCNKPFLFFISPDIKNIPKDYFLFASVVNEFKDCQPLIITQKKVSILGDKKVGKTFLINTLCENYKDNDIFIIKDMIIEDKKYRFEIWENKYKVQRNSNIVIYVFNISDLKSFVQ